MLDRFYVPGDWPSDVVSIDDAEAHHLLHVLRKRKGDRIEIFDGRGRSAEAEVLSLGRSAVEVRIVSRPELHEPSLDNGVTIAVAAAQIGTS